LIFKLFMEYVSPADDWEQVQGLLAELYHWKDKGLIRYVGVTTHNRDLGLHLVYGSLCNILMHRYNMAHQKAEEALLPTAQASGIPLVAFTSTRWGTLLKGHPDWLSIPPSAADCYRFGLFQPAIQLALTALKTLNELQPNLSVLTSSPMTEAEVQHWRVFGDLVYGMGTDTFETSWP
jgi:predicted aldo/keto reductase-like oxidoreductase